MRTFESRGVAVGFVFQHCASAYGESAPAACAASVIVVPDCKTPRIESLSVRRGADVEADCIDTG